MIEQLSFIHFQQILKTLVLLIYFIIENRKATIKDKIVPLPNKYDIDKALYYIKFCESPLHTTSAYL